MYEPFTHRFQNQDQFQDNSMNEDSFLHELLHTQKLNDQFITKPQIHQISQKSNQKIQLQKLILPLKKQTDTFNQENSKQYPFQLNHQPKENNFNQQVADLKIQIPNQKQEQIVKWQSQHHSDQSGITLNKNQTTHSNINQENKKICLKQKSFSNSSSKPLNTQKQQSEFPSIIRKKQQQHKPKIQQLLQQENNKEKEKIHQQLKQTKIQQQKQAKIQQKKQKTIQQQKRKLQKLRQQNRKFLVIKKQKDLKIKLFQNQLKDLKSVKEKQLIKNQKIMLLQQIQEHRKNQKKFYEAMMQQKLAFQKKLFQKEQQIRKKQLEEQQNKKKSEKRKQLLKSTLNLQQLRQKQEQNRKINELKDFLSKRKSFQEKIKNLQLEMMKQKPKPVKQKSQIQLKSQERRLNVKSLSAAEIYKMGQQFMQEAHLLIGPQLIEKSKISFDKSLRKMSESSRTEYKDYLKESQLKKSQFSQSTGKLSSKAEIKQLRNLIVREQNSAEKLLKAKLLSIKLDQKASKKVNTKLKADSIAVKLKIIEEFS